MPAKSKAQARLLGLIASGRRPRKATGLSQSQAREFLRGQKVSRLPERSGPRNRVLRQAGRRRR